MKKAVVIGGSGFVGSHVADQLSDAGYKTIIFDLVPSSYLKKNQEMFVGNILDFSNLDEVCKDAHVVYNFAALSDLNEARHQPKATAEINILGNSIKAFFLKA